MTTLPEGKGDISDEGRLSSKRVAIVTLEGNFNFGNLLQNFALQETLSSMGAETVETIHGIPVEGRALAMLGRRLDGIISDPTAKMSRAIGKLRRIPTGTTPRVPDSRRLAISKFAENHINYTVQPLEEICALPDAREMYDYVFVGSDQVWNPDFTTGNSAWFLSFVPVEKRVAYAASIGVSKIPPYFSRAYRKGLNGMHRISVREHEAAEIVHRLTGTRPPVVVDPTMLQEASFWNDRAILPDALSGRDYVLDFRLKKGDPRPLSSLQYSGLDGTVAEFARQNNLEIVDLFSTNSDELTAISPLEFIGAIRSASLVITDSFHAAVFSTIFHTPYIVEGRGNMNSRFSSLSRISGLDQFVFPPSCRIETLLEINWDHVDDTVARFRGESLSFLQSVVVGN